MTIKILVLLLALLVMIVCGLFILRKRISPYHPLTWAMVEAFWYTISFAAVCIGLTELERIEKLNEFKAKEQLLAEDYSRKQSLLYAQTWLLKIENAKTPGEEAGIRWFHKMKSLFDEGLYTTRWEGFLHYTRAYLLKESPVRTNIRSQALEYGWPRDASLEPDKVFLKDDIRWMADSLSSFEKRKSLLQNERPQENTDYKIRYLFIFFFLLGLSLKFVKIYADYRHKLKL